MIQEGAKDVHDPLLGLDVARLEQEMESYQEWLDERAEEAYKIAAVARAKQKLAELETEQRAGVGPQELANQQTQLPLIDEPHVVLQKLARLDVDDITPRQALELLFELKQSL